MSKIIQFFNQRKNPIVRSIGIYTFTNFFAKGVSFLLLFVFTNPIYILPSENGLLSLFSNGMLFLMPFLSMGIVHSTSTDFFKMNKSDFRSFFTTGFIMPVAVMLFSFIVLFFFKDHLQKAYGFPYMFVWLIPVITFFTFCIEQLLSLIRNNNEPITYLKANVSRTIIELGLSFVLVVYFGWRWEGRVAGIFIAYSILGIYAFYYFAKKGYLFGRVKKVYIRNELIYAIPIIAMQASFFAMSSSDKFFLSSFTNDSNETVGIYSIACIFASIVFVLNGALIQYIFPKIYGLLSSPVIDYASIRKQFVIHAVSMTACTLLIIILTPVLYHYFINERYHRALDYVYLLCIGYFLWSLSFFFYSFLLYYKQKRKILGLSFCCMAVSLACNYFFIRQWNEWGAAIAVVICYIIVLFLTLIFTREYWRQFIFSGKKLAD